MIKKLFGGKSDGFFLELDESANSQATETKVEEKQPEPAATLEPDKQPEPAAVATEEKPSEAPEAKSAKTSKKTSIKNRKKTATKTAATPSPKPTPVSSSRASASSYEPPFWVKAMYNSSSSNGSNGQVGGGQQTFATDNLLPTPSRSRRRPGPSLNKFKEMARQAKVRRR